jgi:hypothetical protein
MLKCTEHGADPTGPFSEPMSIAANQTYNEGKQEDNNMVHGTKLSRHWLAKGAMQFSAIMDTNSI